MTLAPSGSGLRSTPIMRAPLRGRFDYGWLIVGVLALTVTVSYGVLMYAFPVVLAEMQAELGWSQQLLTGAYSLGALASGVAAVPIGRWIDKNGPRMAMTVSAVVASLLVVAWSRARSPASLYLIWIGLGTCSAGLFYEPAFATTAQWFQSGRAKALTIITVAGGLASTIFVPLTAALMERLGWRGAVLVLGYVLAGLTILPHALVLRARSADQGLHLDGQRNEVSSRVMRPRTTSVYAKRALRSSSLRWLVAAFVLSTLANIAFVVHLIPILLELGQALGMASLALAGLGVTKLVGRLLIFPLARRRSVASATVFMFVLQAVGLWILMAWSSIGAVAACVLLFGVGDGASTPARAELVAEFYGSTSYGATSGVIALFLAAARALGPVGMSWAYAAAGGYDAPILFLTFTLIAAGAALQIAGRASGRLDAFA